jgi:hypothetical protein
MEAASSGAKGDRVTVCVHPAALRAFPRTGTPGSNQIPAELTRAVEKPNGVRLEFAQGFAVEMPGVLDRSARAWLVEFPSGAMKVL